MIKTDLSMYDFKEFFDKGRLSGLNFPNGHCFDGPEGYPNTKRYPFHINLSHLYKLATEWKINKTDISLENIIGIIAFGSAVRYPGYILRNKKRRKFLFFGPKITFEIKKPISPRDADFLVLVNSDISYSKKIHHALVMSGGSDLEGYSYGPWIKEGGIHISTRSVNQLIEGVMKNDETSINLIKEGVPIFYDKNKLEEALKNSGVKKENPRKVYWDVNKQQFLYGKIK